MGGATMRSPDGFDQVVTSAANGSHSRFGKLRNLGGYSMQPKEFVSLAGSVAVVTGGGRGIGQAIVSSLAAMEATVVLTGRDETRVQQVASDVQTGGHKAEGIGCDVTDLASVESSFGERLRRS